MSVSTMEQQRHAIERGRILQSLSQEYGRMPVMVATLLGALDALGYPMTPESMQFSLTYLADQGYVVVVRAGDTPGYRRDRANAVLPEAIVTARLLPRGLQLIDGAIAADPGVRF
jgi:hypothetical protein